MLQDKIKKAIQMFPAGFIIFPNGSYANVTVTPIPNTTYTAQYYTPFNNASWNFGDQAPYLISVIGDFFAQPVGNQITEGFILVNILGLIWVRQDDAAIPLFLLWALSGVFFGMGLIPTEWTWFLVAVQFIVLGGIAYTIYRGRRNS